MHATTTENRPTLKSSINFGIKSIDPVFQLNELFGKIFWKQTMIVGVHNKCSFNISVCINGKCFSGTGTTLPEAKKACALLALSSYNSTFDNEKPFIAERKNTVIADDKIIYDDQTSKDIPDVGRNTLTLPKETNCDDKTQNKNKSKTLRNITNFTSISKLEKCTNQPKAETLKNYNINAGKETPASSSFSQMELNNVNSVHVKTNFKSFARNPLKPQILVETNGTCIDSTPDSQKKNHKLKRSREEDGRELNALPEAKRRVTTYKRKWNKQKNCIINQLRSLCPKLKCHGKTKHLISPNVATEILNYLEKKAETIKNPVDSVLQDNNKKCEKIITPNIAESKVSSTVLLPSNLSDIIELKIKQRFDEITHRHKKSRHYKVLAGIVMTHNLDFENSVTVSIATGTKCVIGGNMCNNGTVLNDSHAEILAKRGLMKFLFDNLAGNLTECLSGINIFQRNPINSKVPFKLNPNIHFHLYVNTSPCGDARVYNISGRNFFNGAQYGELRTKIQGEMGTHPLGSRYCHQTWYGVRSGEPLHTMSCSDKIALWNVAGIQGALLSHFVEPIYLHSIVLGDMFNAKHLYRAICGRIEHTLGYLPEPYKLHRPLLGQTSQKSLRGCIFKAPAVGINWSMGDIDIEVISLKHGCTINNQISILSKNVFFYKFTYLWKCFQYSGQITNYAEAKNNAKDFQTCKKEVFEAFSRAGLGIWVKKPIEQNQFFSSYH